MLKFKRNLAFLAIPGVLALGVVTYASVVGAASPTPSPASSSTSEPGESATDSENAAEPAEPTTAAEKAAEAAEPALPGGGHADPDNTQADTQQEGVH